MMVVTLFIGILACVGSLIEAYTIRSISFITFQYAIITLTLGFGLGLLTQMAYYKYLQDIVIETDMGGSE